ncbi:MAG: DUF433 domain-containing protein [Fimbriimonas sp.]
MALLNSDPEILWGVPMIAGTKIPVHAFFEYLESGEGVDGFLSDFPSVSREHAIALIRRAEERLVTAEIGG